MQPASSANAASSSHLLGEDDIALFDRRLAPVAQDVGNHEVLAGDGLAKRHLSDEQVYSWLQSHITDVVRGGPFNYYYDNPEAKTRIICLDTGRYYLSMFRDKLPDTVRFAVESLGSLPEGWHAIIASHIWCSSRFGPNSTIQQYLEGFIRPILRVFDAYNARMAGSYTDSGANVPYDFTQADVQR